MIKFKQLMAAVLLSVVCSPFFFTNVCAAFAVDAFMTRRLLCRPSLAPLPVPGPLSVPVVLPEPRRQSGIPAAHCSRCIGTN